VTETQAPLLDLSDLPLPMRMLPGLRRCDSVRLHRLDATSALAREKRALLDAGWSALKVEGFDEAPVLQTVREHAGAGAGDTTPLPLLVQEDLAVLDGDSGTLPWLSVCTPSHWAPEAKIGLHWAAAHAPVADNDALMAAQRQIIGLCTNGQCWQRSVYTLSADDRYDQHPTRQARTPWPDLQGQALAQRCWLRVERQQFFPVPGRSRQAIFSIRLQFERLDRSAATPDRAQALHDWLATMTQAVADYKGLTAVRPALLAWLALQCGPSSAGRPCHPSGARRDD
jgi:hypothetical protein